MERWRLKKEGEQVRCPCGAVMKKTSKGNWKCPRCGEVWSPDLKELLYTPMMKMY